jgi:hypothetical protein
MNPGDDTPRPLGCYRRGDRWVCYTAADLEALLRLVNDGLPVELVAGEGDRA